MSINLPTIRPNLRTFPGIAPSVNLDHPAAQKARLASVAQDASITDILTGFSTASTGTKSHITPVGPGVSTTTQLTFNTLNYVETVTQLTIAAIFTFSTETGSNRILTGASPVSALFVSTTGTLKFEGISGAAITFTPALPTCIVGHSYFLAASTNSHQTNIILADLTTGKISQGKGASSGTSFNVTGGYTWAFGPVVSKLVANYFGVGYLTPQQLMQWAQDPSGLWYDRSTQNVMQLAVQVASGPTSATLRLAVNDATDTASFNVGIPNNLALAANDAKDTASFNVNIVNHLSLSTNDAQDTASFDVFAANNLVLAANDATDTASFNVTRKNNLVLAANDATDTASFNIDAGANLALTANDATDTASFNIAAGNTFSLAANDATDTASFNVTAVNNLALSANDATDTASFNVAAGNSLALTVNDATDTAAFNVTAVNYLALAANDATDTASFGIFTPAPATLTLAANDAQDTAAFNLAGANNLTLAANDAQDIASFVIAAANNLILAANDAQDTASFNANVANQLTLAANDATDTASFNVNAVPPTSISVNLAANDAQDVASFNTTVPIVPSNPNDGEIVPQWLIDRWLKKHKNTKDQKAKKEKKQIKALLELPVDEIMDKIVNNETGLHGYDEALERLYRQIDVNAALNQSHIKEEEALAAQLAAQRELEAVEAKRLAEMKMAEALDQKLNQHLDDMMTSHFHEVEQEIARRKRNDDEEALLAILHLDTVIASHHNGIRYGDDEAALLVLLGS